MVARVVRFCAQLRSQRRYRRSLARFFLSTLTLILFITVSRPARPHTPIYGRASTPTPVDALIPSGGKTPGFPIDTPIPTATPTEPGGTVPQPIETATPPATDAPTEIPTEAPTQTPPEPSPTPPFQGVLPAIYISEFLADPSAVNDSDGEWMELYNADSATVNLRDWSIADLGANRHRIAADLLIQPGQYLVLGRNAARLENGNFVADYVYSGFDLSNGDDEILLLAPDEREVDRVIWGDGDLRVTSGVSLERSGFTPDAAWEKAWQAWPGSLGDFGSPGAPYAPNPAPPPPTLVPTATPPVAPTGDPVATPTPAAPATPTPGLPDCTTVGAPPDARLFLSEFMANPAAVDDSQGEWIELYNGGAAAVDLRCWTISDFGSDSHTIQAELWLDAGDYVVLARNADGARNGGVSARYAYSGVSLGNDNGNEDELRLLNPDAVQVDLVRWGGENDLRVSRGASLERTSFDDTAAWVTAWQAWPGSAGDLGSPNAPYVVNPAPTETPVLPTIAPTATPPGEPTPVAPTPAPGETPPPPITGPIPRVLISEFLANPDAVNDSVGEWIELFNADSAPVDLRGWRLADLGTDGHTIQQELTIQPGAYLVLGRDGNQAENGGVNIAYVYSSVSLSNGDDEIVLLAPGEREADRVVWGAGSGLDTVKGASLERTDFEADATWATAWQPWPGSAGDFGSPGSAYVANPNPEPIPPPILPTPTPEPGETPPPPITGPIPRVLISEFLANPDAVNDSAGEWIELFNADSAPVNLRGWRLADLGTDGHTIQQELTIQPGAYLVLGRDGNQAENGGVNMAYVYSSVSLSNGDDEIVLLAPGEREADRVVWGAGSGLDTVKGASLERTDFSNDATWATAWQPWPGSAGDFGSPGSAYVANPNPEPIPPPILPTPTPEPGETPPPITGPIPRVRISEFLANPDAVNDSAGEWIELFNADSAPVNLRGWRLADLGTDGHTIQQELTIQPGQYLVIGRNGNQAENGGVNMAYVYSSVSLSNGDDEIVLLAPGEREADRVVWGAGSGLDTVKGASLERTGFDADATWATAWQPWPGSAGDFGSPGSAYVANPEPIPPTPGEPTPVAPTPEPGETPPPPPITGPIPRVLISEFLANPDAVNDSAGEWIELFNADSAPVNLRGWRLADLGTDGHTIQQELTIQPGQYLVIGRNGNQAENGGVNMAYVYSSVSLSNGDDEIVLLAPGEREADRVVWGAGSGLDTVKGASLERIDFSDDATWATAWQPWPGSAGDFGSPGSAYVANPNPELTPPPGEPTPVAPTPEPGETPPPITGDAPRLFISEVLANPSAVTDGAGEWIELYNADTVAVNLRGWRLADEDDDSHTITADLYLLPTQYLVLGRNPDTAANGGVAVSYVYADISLANSADELLLIAPGDRVVDQLDWGSDRTLQVTAGASLERTDFDEDAAWATAYAPWPNSAGDYGSPGAAYVPPPDGPPPEPTPGETPTPPPLPTPPDAGDLPRLWISEFMADPAAVGDNDGEWFELYNGSATPVDLRGWQITDLGSDGHIIDAPLVVGAGDYVVLGRNAILTENGGVPIDYAYDGLSLANGADELLLLAPDAREVDRILWGDGVLSAPRGASLQRFLPDQPDRWFAAEEPWPGSAGDYGTPGEGPGAPPPIITPGITPTPDGTVTPTPEAGAAWPVAAQRDPLRIEEVAFRSSDQEFVALINESDSPFSLQGWSIGDAERAGDGEGIYALPDDVLLAPGVPYVIARDGAAFRQLHGSAPDAQFEAAADDVPVLMRRTELASGRWALSDSGDEVVLLNPAGELVDAVVYGNGDYDALGRNGELRPSGRFSLQHVPGLERDATADQRRRFLYAPPLPFAVRELPMVAMPAAIALDDGYRAVWGSLGARSNFTPGFSAPPRYLAAAASAAGLDFIALADQATVTQVASPKPILMLPAWRWEDEADNAAIIFSPHSAQVENTYALRNWLEKNRAFALWLAGDAPSDDRIRALDGAQAGAPGSLRPLYEAWTTVQRPLLPAGVDNPPLPGSYVASPRYTGLAVAILDEGDMMAAVAQRRGWLSSAPGLWLTLRAENAAGEVAWMGSEIDAQNAVTFHIAYGDRTDEPAGLALWYNDRPLHQLDLPPADGRWSITLPVLPGGRYFVVATQADGDFAVTAPIQGRGGVDGPRLRLDEVMFAPSNDFNGDGVHNDDDEYIELYNAAAIPVDLSGWQLANRWSDEVESRRFTFRRGSFLGGGERLVLWRADVRWFLEDTHDYVRLLAPDGREIDRVDWYGWEGGSIGRDDDESGDWQSNTVASPGAAYDGILGTGNHPEEKPDPGEGQAAGPPGSLAQAKRYGLQRWVEFEAVVVAPPGLFNSSMYVADISADGVTGGLGIQLYLRKGEFPPLEEGDRVRVRGITTSFRGEMEVELDGPEQLWRMDAGRPLAPLTILPSEVGETLEGRLVTFQGVVTGYQGDSIYLVDPADLDAEPVRVTVRSSLPWRRPYVNPGERFTVTGIVSQFALEKPWNGGYRVLVRYPQDLVEE